MGRNKGKPDSDAGQSLNPHSGMRLEPVLGRQLLEKDSQERFAEPLRKARTDDQKALPEIGETGRHSMYLSNHSRAQKERMYLGIDLRAEEWAALFYQVLGCPDPSKYPYSQEESSDQYEDRYRKLFQDAIPAYPMLARIWDMYTDVEYQPNEIDQLRAECERVKLVNSNLAASEWLDKMLGGCDAAIQRGLGLYLASD
jgi:hypothetical protein